MKALVEKKSPFAVFDATERIVKVEPSFRASVYITDLDKAILTVINSNLVSTSALLFKQLQTREDVVDQAIIKQRLNKLWKAEFVDKYQYINKDGSYSANKTYALGYRGRGFLKATGIQVNKQQYLQNMFEKEPTQIKRILSAQQFAISIECNNFKIGEVAFIPHREIAKHIFRPHATIETNKETIFVESIRNDGTLKEFISDKARRILDVCKNKSKANIEISNPVVVLICEDMNHMRCVQKELENNLKITNIKFMITNDLDVYGGRANLVQVNVQKSSFLDLFINRKAS